MAISCHFIIVVLKAIVAGAHFSFEIGQNQGTTITIQNGYSELVFLFHIVLVTCASLCHSPHSFPSVTVLIFFQFHVPSNLLKNIFHQLNKRSVLNGMTTSHRLGLASLGVGPPKNASTSL